MPLKPLEQRERELHEHYAARIKAAEMEDRMLRAQAWVTDRYHYIAGIKCRHLTLQDIMDLEYAGNGYITGKPVTDGDSINFLWLLSLKYRYDSPKRKAWFSTWHLRKVDRIRARIEILQYIEHVFADAPKGDTQPNAAPGQKAALCWLPNVISRIASAYGWPLDQITALPAMQAFSLLYEIRATKAIEAGKTAPIPPAKVQSIRAEFLTEITKIIQEKESLKHAQARN